MMEASMRSFLNYSMPAALLAAILVQGCMQDNADDGETAITAVEALTGPKMYIVRLKDGVNIDETLQDLEIAHGAGVTHRHHHALKGGALLIPNEAAYNAIVNDSRVLSVEQDRPVSNGKPAPAPTTPAPQKDPTGYRLIGAPETANEGMGVRVAVIDTGADLNHPDLVANLDPLLVKDCVNENTLPAEDLNGHGTHVSGTIAAVNNTIGSVGIGAEIKIVPVKVLNRRGSGSWSTIICGVDYVTAHAAEIQVANMSLGGSGSECSDTTCTKSALQVAIENSVAAGVTYAVAAGNESTNSATKVPAAYDAVITVSAYRDLDGLLDSTDGWASFTNFGADVDIAAPGYSIFSTWKGDTYNTISGTSMASPHVAAAAALYASTHPGATPAEIKAALIAGATTVYPGSTDAKHAEPLLNVRSF